MTLDEFQEVFWRDLWAEEHTGQVGFSVYRNTVMKGCLDALTSLYPAVHRLMGDAWMRFVALDYARIQPPSSGSLQHYGAGFPAFLADLVDAEGAGDGDVPWLGEVAQLDRFWAECHVAADATVLDLTSLIQVDPERLARSRLMPHPAARWRWSSTWPAFSLWDAARKLSIDPNPSRWQGQGVLLTRPAGVVIAIEIDAADVALLDACAEGQALGAALDNFQAHAPDLDPGASLGRLLQQGAFTAVMEISS